MIRVVSTRRLGAVGTGKAMRTEWNEQYPEPQASVSTSRLDGQAVGELSV